MRSLCTELLTLSIVVFPLSEHRLHQLYKKKRINKNHYVKNQSRMTPFKIRKTTNQERKKKAAPLSLPLPLPLSLRSLLLNPDCSLASSLSKE
jgi:hypothetical protein